jgi:hypothetical protein
MNKAKKVFVSLLVIGVAAALTISMSYMLWMTADENKGYGAFLKGLFGPSAATPVSIIYTYESPYQSAKALANGEHSPVYLLGTDILEDISPSEGLKAIPDHYTRQLYIPSGMRYEGTGLFICYLNQNNQFSVVKTTRSEAISLFDPHKPTMIYIHGMQNEGGAIDDERCAYMAPYIQAGYNLLLFRWSQFSDEASPWDAEGKIWGTNKGTFKEGMLYGMRWRVALNQNESDYVSDDVPNASVAEIFGAFYLDFMSRFDYEGSMIEISGHSMGGQVAFAAASFLLTKEQEGLINPSYLPDKVTLFDPYITQIFDGAYCAWLKKPVSAYVNDKDGNPEYFAPGIRKFTASIDLMAEIAKALKDRGIATQVIPAETGYVYVLAKIYTDDAYKKLCDNTVTIRYRSDWVTDRITNFNSFHMAGRNWYIDSVNNKVYADTAMNNTPDVTPSARTMLAYAYARMGTSYSMEENLTEDNYADDIFASDNIENARIAGFAFYDANGDGIYNERIQARMAGVKVELYRVDGRKNILVATQITDASGYYSFDIPRINANGFDKFYIRIIAPKGYQIGERGRYDDCMGNNIRQIDSLSDTVTLAHYKSLSIINIGLSKADV